MIKDRGVNGCALMVDIFSYSNTVGSEGGAVCVRVVEGGVRPTGCPQKSMKSRFFTHFGTRFEAAQTTLCVKRHELLMIFQDSDDFGSKISDFSRRSPKRALQWLGTARKLKINVFAKRALS